jgi:hypothetical protein
LRYLYQNNRKRAKMERPALLYLAWKNHGFKMDKINMLGMEEFCKKFTILASSNLLT